MTVPFDFLGSGLAYDVRFDADTGGLATVAGVDSVRASLRRLFETGIGEEFFLPEYGCDLNRLVFEADTEALRAMVDVTIRQAVARWEPRIAEILDIQVISGELTGVSNSLAIRMLFRLIGSQTVENFVLPFYQGS